MTDAGAVHTWLEQELRRAAEDLTAGRDVSPARQYRLEGAIECWLRQHQLGDAELRGWLANCGVNAEVEQGSVRLRLAMRRAPVRPTTSD